jgi:eukaryotic-like serine/threonine-protein kinase
VRDGVTPAAGQRVRAPEKAEKPSERRRVGRYDLLFEIARGGMGAVWVGRLRGPDGFGRFVAVKAMQKTEHDEAFLQFREEAKVAARIHHPNVVQTLELFEHDGEPFMVMDLVQGVSLARLHERLMETREALPPEVAAWIVMQIASGLHVAHELDDRDGRPLGLVHRDVSPQNILLSFDGRAYIADFGVAKFHRESFATESGVIKGKFAYMSPEQARAKPLDRRSDIFALGIVLHEALTGERLYPAEHAADALIRIVSVPAPEAHHVRPSVPNVLSQIASKCLEKKPEDRYATASELRDALRSALQSLGKNVDEQRLAEILARFFRRDAETLRKRLAALDGDGADDPGTMLPLEAAGDATTVRASRPPTSLESGARAIDRPPTMEQGQGTSHTSLPLAGRGRIALVLVLLIALVVGGGALYVVKHRSTPPAIATTPPEPSDPSASMTTSSDPPIATTTGTTTAMAPATSSSPSPKILRPRPTSGGGGRVAPTKESSPPAPSPSPTPTPTGTFKGKPFDNF